MALHAPNTAYAQADTASPPATWLWLSDESVGRLRLAHLGGAATAGFLLRSPSSLLPRSTQGTRVQLLPFRTRVIDNSAIPFSMNDGALWAGRGTSTMVSAGMRLAFWRFRAVLAPEWIVSENADWVVIDSALFGVPGIQPERNGRGYAFPWYTGPYSADIPTRFGLEYIRSLSPGQSSLYAQIGGVELGVATENEWWGPGIRNALILSDNAPGFPHAFVRSATPWRTRLGIIEWRWLVGGLEESKYFDTTSTNDLRSLSAAAITLEPSRLPGVTVGAARSVMGTARNWNEISLRWLEVLHATGRPNDVAFGDSALYPGGREQLFSLFGRYVAPAAGTEIYAEWGRTELPSSVRDLLVAPNHTQGYTVGLQWTTPAAATRVTRVQGEITTIEQSATFRDRPLGIWYTSRRVIQGYTNRGQSLGAAIGPGSSSQWLAIDRIDRRWAIGVYGGRIRWNEDVRSLFRWPDYQRTCTHDVTLYWGMRGERRWRRAFVAADAAFANRINFLFQVGSGCPGNNMRDVRNNTLSLTAGVL